LLLFTKKLVVLDEATSFLDLEIEKAVLMKLKEKIEAIDGSLIVVGHKLGGLKEIAVEKVLEIRGGSDWSISK
jgi:ABC-type transport system involved in cytochrome bd biosynthesis fused ATPase/permease subunit